MIRHGGTFPFARRKIDPKDGKLAKGANGAAYSGVSGFRHFMHEPAPEQRFPHFNGAHAGRSEHEVLHQLMGQLGERMSEKFDWPAHGVAGAEAWENPHIPSGYTYLLQLVAHDLVHSSVPMSVIEDSGSGMLNARRSGLRLETIYGGGPMVCPLAYALDDKQDESRTKLRLGSIPDDPDIRQKGCPYRDIARVRPYGVNGDDRDPTRYNEPFPARTDPLIADPRNDAHVILSQMTALFHHLHNGILDLLPEAGRQGSGGIESRGGPRALSLRARRRDPDLSQCRPQRADAAGAAPGRPCGLSEARLRLPRRHAPQRTGSAGASRGSSRTARSVSRTQWSGPGTTSTATPRTPASAR